MLVFQLLLLVGYGYSVLLARLAASAWRVHACCIALAALITPFSVRWLWLKPDPHVAPVVWIVAVVIGAIGLPFCLLSATSPLLQLWLARARVDDRLPSVHRLYAVANLANFAGLGLYVVLLEPLLGARVQAWVLLGSCLLALLLSLYVARASQVTASPTSTLQPTAALPYEASSWRERSSWTIRSFAASFLLFAVSTYLAADVAAFPLLFVIPLGLFLLAFALGYSPWAERRRDFLHVSALVMAVLALTPTLLARPASHKVAAFVIPLVSLLFLVTTLALRLADERPARSERLPEYYAAIGVGGVLAGVVCVLVFPWLWTRVWGDTTYVATTRAALSNGSVFKSSAIPDLAPWQRATSDTTAHAWTDDWANPLGDLRAFASLKQALHL
ncbi:MAG: hypothetical protein RL701_7444, partial [Pseudomonadota bacterium]